MARLLMRLASFARVIRFDRRGTGASDPVPIQALPPWETYVEDLVAVMDAVRSKVATVMAVLTPDHGHGVRGDQAGTNRRTHSGEHGGEVPMGCRPPVRHAPRGGGSAHRPGHRPVGTEALVWIAVPSRAADERYRRWHARLQRSMASPGAVQAYLRALFHMDARAVLESIHVPTLILHRKELALVPLDQGRYLAQHIPHATLVELDGTNLSLVHQGGDELVGRIEEFMTASAAVGARTACSPPCCSATSSVRPPSPAAWETSSGVSDSKPTMRSRGGVWSGSRDVWSS
jgi:pimeloyl-ACP methyl ester carboxylesterase